MSTVIALPAALPGRGLFVELAERQRALTAFGIALLLLAIPALAAQGIDPRMLNGASVWVKPVKFLVSIGTYALTLTWFYGYASADWRRSATARRTAWAVMIAGGLEVAWITLQAARGQASHFNESTPLNAAMYAAMGIAAVVLIGASLPVAAAIVRRPDPGLGRDMQVALVAGLVLSVILGGGLGGYMSTTGSHAVGPQGNNLAVFGWNRLGGDMRIAHFMGIHVAQALPFAAFLLSGRPAAVRRIALPAFGLAWVAVTLLVFAQAIAGRPLLPV